MTSLSLSRTKRQWMWLCVILRSLVKHPKKSQYLLKIKFPQVPWEEMYYLRNKVYHGIDYSIIWDVATNYLPENKSEIDKIIDLELADLH
jgi:uncharacterized protein with HEPN domain